MAARLRLQTVSLLAAVGYQHMGNRYIRDQFRAETEDLDLLEQVHLALRVHLAKILLVARAERMEFRAVAVVTALEAAEAAEEVHSLSEALAERAELALEV